MKLTNFKAYKFYDNRNKDKYKEAFKQRTGRDTARGWNNSPEYRKYERSQTNRQKTYLKRNPLDFAQNFEKIKQTEFLKSWSMDESGSSVINSLNPRQNNITESELWREAVEMSIWNNQPLRPTFVIRDETGFTGQTYVTQDENQANRILNRIRQSYRDFASNQKASDNDDYGLLLDDTEAMYFDNGDELDAIFDITLSIVDR